MARGPQTETLTATGIPGPGIDTKTTAFSATGTASASVSTNQPGDLVVAFAAGDSPALVAARRRRSAGAV